MINGKKIMAAVLTCAMLASVSACTNKGNPDDIIDAADSFAKNVAALNAGKMLKQMEEIDDDKAESIKNKLAMSDMSDDERTVKQAIAATISYEVNEDSVEFDGDEATCDVVFTMVDYADVIGDLSGSADDFTSAISDADADKEYEVTFTFVKDGDEWIVGEDSLDELSGLYSFINYELSLGAAGGDILEMIQRTSWWLSDEGTYTNAEYIELDLWFTENPGIDVYYEVYQGSSLIYTSNPETFSTSYFEAVYGEEQGAALTEGKIPAGTYGIKIYEAGNGTLLADETCTVEVSSTESSASSATGDSDTYQLLNPSFANIKELGWWDYGIEEADGSEHGTMASEGIYCSDTETIAFSVELNEAGPAIYFAYYFIPEGGDASAVDYANPTFAQTIESTSYQDGSIYYDIDYTPDTMAVGTYILVVAADQASVSSPYITAACQVIAQSSAEFMDN